MNRHVFGLRHRSKAVRSRLGQQRELDNKPVTSGDRLPIGWHKFNVSHPKAKSFSTNLFIWYGEHNLGEIALTKRQTGTVSVSQPVRRPPYDSGPEILGGLDKQSGSDVLGPNDSYQ